MNKVFVLGNLTRDPELKTLPSGSNVCNFSIATNRTWTDKQSNEKKQSVEFHNIVIFGRMADTVAQYMRKGSQLLVEGRLQTSSWEDQNQVKKYKTEIVAESVQFGAKSQNSDQQPANTTAPPVQANNQPVNDGNQEISVDDIPF